MAILVLIFSIVITYLYDNHHRDYEDSLYLVTQDDNQYNLRKPKARWDLPSELEEISGLSFFKRNQLACVQDEKGFFYIYSLKKKEIFRKDKFGDNGDYEGVEVVNDTAYVLNSNGDVSYFQVSRNGIGKVNQLKTDLTRKNDSEGLGFDLYQNEILIACKEEPGTKKVDVDKSRTIYRITNPDKKFKKKPKYIIDGESYKKMIEKKGMSKKMHTPFKPSGVAVHPKSKNVFVIGTVGKMMIILSPEGKIMDLIPLDPKVFLQPEGICFSPEGELFISSEGRGGKGYILKF